MHTYKVFAIKSSGGWSAGRRHHDSQDELVQLIDILLASDIVIYVEVHDGSCSVRP